MLALDSPLGTVAGTVLFGDHADARLVHVIPTAPRLASTDGRPDMSLQTVPPEDATEEGAALLTFVTELTVDDAQRAAIRDHLDDLGMTEVRLAPVQWKAGRAVLATALSEGDGFVERALGETPVGDGGANRAVFSLLLSEQGASLVHGLLSQDSGPSALGIRYELTYLGLRPALDVRIRADYGRVFDEFAMGFEFGVAYQGVGVRAGVDIATRRLVENGAIEIEVMHFTDDADFRTRVDKAVQWFQERLLRDFFTSSLQPPGQEDLLARATSAAVALGAATLQDALEDSEMARSLAERVGLPLDSLKGLASGAGPGASEGTTTFALNLQFQFRDITIQERKVVELDWREAHAEERSAAPQALLRDLNAVPVVVPAHETAALWERLDVHVRPLGDFEALGVERMDVRLAYPDELAAGRRENTLTFSASSAEPQRFAAFTDGRPPQYRYRTQAQFRDDGPIPGPPLEDGPWRSSSAQELAVHALAEVDLLDLEVTSGTVDMEEVPQVQVDLQVDGQHVTSLTLTAETPSVRHRRRLPRPPEPPPGQGGGGSAGSPGASTGDTPASGADSGVVRGVLGRATFRPTWFLASGQRVTGELMSLDSPLLQIPGPWRGERRIRVFPLLPDDILEATVTLSLVGSSRRSTVHFGPDSERRSVEVVLLSLQADPAPAVVETFVLRGDGVSFVDRYETEAAVVMVQPGRGQHRRVDVRLIAGENLMTHGVIAVQVQLLDESGSPVDSVTFTASERAPGELLVPLAPDGSATPARYLITRFRPDGVAVPQPVLETIEDSLLVPAAIPAGPVQPESPADPVG